jgi:hypothetical protein
MCDRMQALLFASFNDDNLGMEPLQLLTRSADHWALLASWSADKSLAGLGAQSDEDLLAVLRTAEDIARLVGAVQVQAAALVEERSDVGGVSDGLAARYGHSRAVHLIEQVTRIGQGDAYKRIRLGKNIRTTTSFTGEPIPPKFPAIARAVEAGVISIQVADRITTGLEQARKFHIAGEAEQPGEFEENLAAAEEALVDEATRESADLVQVQVTQWREVLDPDGRQMRDEDIRTRRGLVKGREHNGITRWMWHTTGTTTAFLIEIMAEARRAAVPRFLPTEERNLLDPDGITFASAEETAAVLAGNTLDDNTLDGLDASDPDTGSNPDADVEDAPQSGFDCPDSPDSPAGNGDDEVAVVKRIEDPRTPQQRDSDVLEGYLRAGLRASENEMGSFRPIVEVTAVATLNDLYEGRGVGWIHGVDEPISIEYVQELACESGVRLVIQGDHGEILWMASKPRKFTDAVKRAVIVRDGPTCVIDGCHKPARQCDVHHVHFHSQGGTSNADNAVVLCSEHHHLIHNSPFRIEMHHGTPYLLAPRWLNPKQTWKPLSHPKHRLRTPDDHHTENDYSDY